MVTSDHHLCYQKYAQCAPKLPASSMDGDESGASLHRVLVDRCQSLEASHEKLREELNELRQENKRKVDMVTSDSGWGYSPGFLMARSLYRSVLECMGHAVHVSTASSGEIIYWNRSAEHLYGWKDYDVLGRKVSELLIAEEYHTPLNKIMERLSSGQSWSGQFPFKKRSGEMFMAIVTKSPLYEDGELVGIITVSSDAAMFNITNSENLRTYQDRGRVWGQQVKKIQWQPLLPQIAPVPHIASSVSNLASKLLSRRHGDDTCIRSRDMEDTATGTEDFNLEKPGTLAGKVLAKLHIGTGNSGKEDDGGAQQNDASDTWLRNEVVNEPNSPRSLKASPSYNSTIDTEDKGESLHKRNSSFAARYTYGHRIPNAYDESSLVGSSRGCHECFELPRPGEPMPRLGCQVDVNELEPEVPNLEAMEIEDEGQRESDGKRFPSLGESIGSRGSSSSKGDNESSSKGDNESNSMVDCEIHWEDLHLGEEVGQGSYAVVYRAIWNLSDVAVKVYFGNQYNEGTLEDYNKEIDIMKKLRHPNVLLFMGAVYSQERLAIVTEYLPRGSLFRTLHKNNQALLDIKRRLKMALDVARGMNYLHHRNPPIVHRDLKSSNLLVDRNWTVKVGDFGLSKWKNATFITAKSGRGTPQWMAPEVLRNEPSNEKSDVFSFGVIFWELMTTSIPWNNLNSFQVVGIVGFMDRRLDVPESLDPHVASIIHDCWQSDPEQRPSFEDIIQRMTCLVHKVATTSMQKNSAP